MPCQESNCDKTAMVNEAFCIEHLVAVEGSLERALEYMITGQELRIENAVLDLGDLGDLAEAAAEHHLRFDHIRFVLIGATIRRRSATAWPQRLTEVFGSVTLQSTTFQEAVEFRKCHFGEGSRLEHLRFASSCRFVECSWSEATFQDLSVGGALTFDNCNTARCEIRRIWWRGSFQFNGGSIGPRLTLSDSHAEDAELRLDNVQINNDCSIGVLDCKQLYLQNCTIGSRFRMSYLEIGDSLYLLDSTLGDEFIVESCKVRGPASVGGCKFGSLARFDLRSDDHLSFGSSDFKALASLSACAPRVHVYRCDFTNGGSIRARSECLELEIVRSVETLTIGPYTKVDSHSVERPKLTKIYDVDLANLTLASADLSQCIFTEVRNMDKLRLEPGTVLARFKRQFSSPRDALAEEVHYRSGYTFRVLGLDFVLHPGHHRQGLNSETPQKLASQYRKLRKARESEGDEPGAADFYYGEMEMRRRSGRSWESPLLYLYWIISGYGLRASRAAIFLLLALAASTIIFATAGLEPTAQSFQISEPTPGGGYSTVTRQIPGARPGVVDSALFAVRAATSLIRPTPMVNLSTLGQVTEIVLRLLAPLLIALGAFAIRGRVKR